MSKSFRINIDLTGVDAAMDGLAEQAEAAARPAAQAMAQVLYDEVKRNVSRIRRHSGNLAASIYQVYSKDNSGKGHATYHVSWNARKAPHGYNVEFGHLQRYEVSYDPITKRFTTHKDRPLPAPRQVAARPFLRPALGKVPAAQAAGRDEFLRRLGLLIDRTGGQPK